MCSQTRNSYAKAFDNQSRSKNLKPKKSRGQFDPPPPSLKASRVKSGILRYQIEISRNADVSENTLPFVSQSINNFSDYDISQSVDWQCPSLSPHVLLILRFTLRLYMIIYCSRFDNYLDLPQVDSLIFLVMARCIGTIKILKGQKPQK